LVIAAVMLGASVPAAWPVLLPTASAPAAGPLFVVPRGRLAVLGVVALIAFMAEGAMGDWSAIYIRMDLGASPATAAWGFAAFSLTMAIGRFSGDRLVARFSPAAILVAGAVIGAATLAVALLVGHPAAAVVGFAGMGFGLANVAPIVFSAAGRLPELAPGIGIAAVSTAGYGGFLAGPPLIGLVAEASGLPVGLGLVALAVGFMALGTGALRRQPTAAVALAG
jgi:fucose permease